MEANPRAAGTREQVKREEVSLEVKSCREQLKMFERIFDSIHNGTMVTDEKGYITHFNAPYGQFLGLDPALQIGRHCTEVVENTRMHIVAQTGKPEINHVHRIQGQDMVVQRIPIKKDGKVIAVFGQVMFKDVRDVGKLAKKIALLESKVKHYEEELMALRSTRYTFDSIVGQQPAHPAIEKGSPQGHRQPVPRPDHRGKRDREGTFCPGHSSRKPPKAVPLRPHQLFRHPPGPVGVRALRIRVRGLYRRQGRRQARKDRTGPPGNPFFG